MRLVITRPMTSERRRLRLRAQCAEAVGQGVELAIGDLAAVVLDGDVVAEFVDRLFEVVTKQDRAVQLDRLDPLEQPPETGGEFEVAPMFAARPMIAVTPYAPSVLLMDNPPARVNSHANSERWSVQVSGCPWRRCAGAAWSSSTVQTGAF
jgi:hypothetical protein